MNSTDQFSAIIEQTRQNLLDLSLRNRLINTPRGQTRTSRLDIVQESSDQLYRLLVRENKTLSFLPSRPEPDSTPRDPQANSLPQELMLDQPGEDSNEGLAARQRDNQLQTQLTSSQLQDRLLRLYYDARTFVEEQGVSVLYLALGFLEWFETELSDKPRYAPLILVPVDLSRPSVSSKFRLKFREGDLETNLSLQAKLKSDFGLELPNVGEIDEFAPANYFGSVKSAVQSQPKWKVHGDDIALWFFSFEKHLMYRDLDHTTWPAQLPLTDNESLRRLLVSGFEASPPLCDDLAPLDPLLPVQELTHMTDADSSQAVAIEEVRRGRNLVIQGPPGTGKSQTITNIIATAVRGGKTVLFVAEKMAALEVVKNRLDRVGLGSICLELHSHNANKKSVLEELNRTIQLGRPRSTGGGDQIQALTNVREGLNRHATLMNSPWKPTGITPFQILGQLVRYHAEGDTSIPLELDHPERWSRIEFEERQRHLVEFESYVSEMDDVISHPWRGVRRTEPVLPSELQQLLNLVGELSKKFELLIEEAKTLCVTLKVALLVDPTLKSLKRLVSLGQICVGHPEMDRKAIADTVWQVHPAKIQKLVAAGRTLTASRIVADGLASEAAWSTDLTEIRHSLVSYGRCWLWFLYPSYWKALDQLRGVLKGPPPAHLDQQLNLIEALIDGQAAKREIREASDSIGLPAFGSMWNAEDSDFDALQRIVEWEQSGRERLVEQAFRTVASALDELPPIQTAIDAVESRLRIIDAECTSIRQSLQLDSSGAFSRGSFDEIPLHELAERFAKWRANPELLSKWIGYQNQRKTIEGHGLQSLIAAFERGDVEQTSIVWRFCQTYYEAVLAELYAKNPELAAFHGPSHQRQIDRYRELDLERMNLARSEVATTHFAKIPRESSLGEMAVIRGEIAKKRMHRPIRQLLREAGHAVQSIKPVFMMSPMSVARFLEPGTLEFDLLVIDEASQVTPEDALGAIARARQIVVVGDSRQLPPSRFFSKMMEDDTEEGDGQVTPSHLESVLGLCVARGVPQRMLRWHYRSRHHSLIAVSNQEFYENQLCVIPNPTAVRDGLGLQFRLVANGRFDRGATATNRREAIAIADAVIEHARTRPTKSLGVAAFSVAQRDAIRNELEARLRKAPELEEFFSTSYPERFFVKNLENVQGDERDFIFISVGYAPDPSGAMTMNFGPLGTDGGERRLNVLISRAKEACVVFSSITADQIDLQRARSRGAAALKTFLQFAATARLGTTSTANDSSESEFERQVALSLEQSGIEVERQVGTTGFAIDLAIVDHDQPDQFLLGVEFDGTTYSNSRWARDRDRLRESLLRDRGWNLQRVWSVDWFQRPEEQLQKLLTAIEAARSLAKTGDENTLATAAPIEDSGQIDRETTVETVSSGASTIQSYQEADFAVASNVPILDLPEETLRQVVIDVVKAEGPVHRDEVARRLLSLWKQQRLMPKVAKKIDGAIAVLVNSRRLERDHDAFLTLPSQSIRVRSRLNVVSQGLRKPEMIPPSEIQTAICLLAQENVGITRDQLYTAMTKSLGLKIVSPRLKTLIEDNLNRLIQDRTIELRDERLYHVNGEA